MYLKLRQLLNHSGFRRYAGNTFWLMAEKILRMLLGLLVIFWVARYLGPEQFGLLNYAQSFVLLFSTIAALGLDSIIVRELVKYPDRRDILLGTAFLLKLLAACCVLLVLALAVQFTDNDSFTNLLVFIIGSATVFQSLNVIDFYYQSKVLSKYVAFANTVSVLLSSVIKVLMILNNAPLIYFAVMYAFDAFVLALGFIYFYMQSSRLSLFAWRFDWSAAKQLLNDSWPLILSGLLISAYMRIDQVMIKEMLNLKAVGEYAAAVRVSEAWYIVGVVIVTSLFPAIINAKAISQELYQLRLKKLFSILNVIGLLVAIIMSIFAQEIIQLLYGNVYSAATDVLIIHIWSGVFVFMGVASSRWFIVEKLQKYIFWRTLLGFVVNILLNLVLIPEYGIEGAAIATLVSQLFAALVFDIITSKTRVLFKLKMKSFLNIG